MHRTRLVSVRALVPLCLVLALAGCETMSEDQCKRADWGERGRTDGRNGEPEDFIDAHRRACAKANVQPDERRWRQGWAEGVRSYCVPIVGWQRGLDNRSYYGACRDYDEAHFMRWYRAGQDAYRTRSERESKQREIDKLEDRLKKAQKDDERRSLREQIRQLDNEQARLRRLYETQMSGAPR